MIKHHLLLRHTTFIIITFITTYGYSQKKGYEKIRALKVAHITSELNLSPKEAQSFWPIYNEHNEKMKTLRTQEKKTVTPDMQVVGRLTEKEASTLLDTLQNIRKKRLESEQDLVKRLSEVISKKKIVLLARAEDNFKRKLLKQYDDQNRVIDLRKKAMQERRKEKIQEKTTN